GDAQLLGDDLLDALFDVVHYPSKGKKLAHECECAHFIRFDLAEKRRSRFRNGYPRRRLSKVLQQAHQGADST
ncbi:MAG TPA: hypothetical protein VMJ11_03415, partial [Paraburkholderia sp.]|uniref:hypothetical protein n=1 Tax=Paraburkholderia sp. TaxID=1926495 RepID=UPI002CB19D3A